VKHAFADHGKVKAVFHPPPNTNLSTGLRRMAQWASLTGARRGAPMTAVEIPDLVPESWR
jgi:UDP-glucose 4-epimerase